MNNVINKYFTSHLKNILKNSQRYSGTKKNQEIEIIDIFRATLDEEGSVAFNILRNIPIFPNEKKANAIKKTKKKTKKLEDLVFSKKAHKMIINAIKLAQEFHFPYVGTEHLLFSILESFDEDTYKIIGNDKEELKNVVAQLKRVMKAADEVIEDPLFFINYPSKKEKQDILFENKLKKDIHEDNFIGEISDYFSSLLKKRNGNLNNTSPQSFLNNARPSFGMIMGGAEKKKSFLEHFGRNLNEDVARGKADPVIGRDKEIEELVRTLIRRSKNNPVLVGDPGVGKTAIVSGLAQKIVDREVPPSLIGKKVISLDLGLLVAGTSFRGEFEDRFKRVLEEAEGDPNVIIFIDELHNLVGAGSAQGSLDAANIIKPALARGLLRCIGATTGEEYSRYIEKDGALERRFQPIWVKEPNKIDATKILKGLRKHYEDYHNVKIADRAIDKTVDLANRYINDRFLPDKAIDLLDEAAAFVVQDEHRQGTTSRLQSIEKQKERLSILKEKMVQNGNLDLAADLQKDEKELNRVIKDLQVKVAEERRLIPVVDDSDVAQVLAKKLNIPFELIMEDATERLEDLAKKLKENMKGQNKVIDRVSATLKRSLVGIADPERPATAFLFVGPTGVGKTYLAKLLAKEIFLKPEALIRVDMSEFNEKHTVSRLLGSPPGYVGHGEYNVFTDKIRKNPYSVVLFDEIEKAHPEVFHIMLQVLEDGFLTDGNGKKISFRKSIIIFTSNLGNDEFLKRAMGFSDNEKTDSYSGKKSSIESKNNKREKTMVKKKLREFLKPEFLNRLSEIVFFQPLGNSEIKEITKIELTKLSKRLLATKKIKLVVDKDVIKILAQKCVSRNDGVRIIRRLIQKKIEEPIAHGILAGKIVRGTKVIIEKGEKGTSKFKVKIVLRKISKVQAGVKTEPAYSKK